MASRDVRVDSAGTVASVDSAAPSESGSDFEHIDYGVDTKKEWKEIGPERWGVKHWLSRFQTSE
eukprot:16767-Amorphochlora_amoeboformis.AAC.1